MKVSRNRLRIGLLTSLVFALAACQASNATHAGSAGAMPIVASNAGESGILAFAQAACGGCHAVRPNTLSPNPASPAFAEIANRMGLSQASLATWLSDAHNYPEDMDFDLDSKQIDALAAYILTLRDPAYRAPIS
jgi:mono/diheme cytochrome c family protein